MRKLPLAAFAVIAGICTACSSTAANPPAHHKPAADVSVCRKLEAYPSFTPYPGARLYVRFLRVEEARRGVSLRLSSAIGLEAAELSEMLDGIGSSQHQVKQQAAKLQAVCTAYGVTG